MSTIDLTLTNEQRFIVLELFETQNVQMQDYTGALIWKETFEKLIDEWVWRTVYRAGRNNLLDPDKEITLRVTPENAHVIALQLLISIRSGTFTGGPIRHMIDVIERIRKHIPGIIELAR